jgi:cytochrome c oxidase accessory protein FixG
MGIWIAGAALCYFDFAIVRQTFCKYLCPYARFQSVLLDRDSLVVAYDPVRGEPRGKAKATAHGDCVDCGLCVAVCPTGIDIRNGLQLECIGCTQCIDACDSVMARLGRRARLIGYRSLAALDGRRTRWHRPRVVIYGVLLLATIAGFAATAVRRAPLALEVERNRATLWQRMPDGRVSNAYTLHIQNRDRRDHVYRVRLEDGDDFALIAGVNPLRIPALGNVTASIFVVAERAESAAPAASGGRTIHFVLEDLDRPDRPIVRHSTFVAPAGAHEESRREEARHAG